MTEHTRTLVHDIEIYIQQTQSVRKEHIYMPWKYSPSRCDREFLRREIRQALIEESQISFTQISGTRRPRSAFNLSTAALNGGRASAYLHR